MKYLSFLILSFIFSSKSFAEVTLETESSSIIVAAKTPPALTQPNEKVSRAPAATTPVAESETRINLQVSSSLINGKVYFGGKPTKVEFNSIDVDLLFLKKNFVYGLQYNNVYNQASIKINNLGVNLGYKQDFSRVQVLLYGGLGVSNYKESSNLQSINVLGPSVSATAAVNFFVWDSLYLNANYKYLHTMYTSNVSYWGSDHRTDVVYDLHGLGVGLGWSF